MLNSTRPVRLRVYGASSAEQMSHIDQPPTDATQLAQRSGAVEKRKAVERPLDISLEEALLRLAQLPRMFIEPDGSFLWTGAGSDDSAAWQLEGTIYDDGRVVRYIELHGHCPLQQWDDFLAAFSQSRASVVLELLDEGLVVGGEWLRRHGSRHSDRQRDEV